MKLSIDVLANVVHTTTLSQREVRMYLDLLDQADESSRRAQFLTAALVAYKLKAAGLTAFDEREVDNVLTIVKEARARDVNSSTLIAVLRKVLESLLQ